MLRGLGPLALALATTGAASAQYYPTYPAGGGYPPPPNFGARQPQSPISPSTSTTRAPASSHSSLFTSGVSDGRNTHASMPARAA